MTKITLPDITSGYNLSAINSNFQKIEDTLNKEVLYRKEYLGEPNEMQTNLDMNGKQILNVTTGTSDGSLVTKGYVDQELALKFDKSGGPISGPIDMGNNEIINTSRLSTDALEVGGVPVVPTSLVIDPYNGTREALRRSYAEAGYNLVDGSFEAGGTLVNANDVLLQERTGKAFSGPAGDVAAGTNPAMGGFTDRSQEAIRTQLALFDGGKLSGFGRGGAYPLSSVYQKLLKIYELSEFGKATETVQDLQGVVGSGANDKLVLDGYFAGSRVGGGTFIWRGDLPKTKHDGGLFIDPSKTFPSNWASGAAAWFDATGSTGNGVWQRIRDGECLRAEWYGAVPWVVGGIQDSSESFIQVATVAGISGEWVFSGKHRITKTIPIPARQTFGSTSLNFPQYRGITSQPENFNGVNTGDMKFSNSVFYDADTGAAFRCDEGVRPEKFILYGKGLNTTGRNVFGFVPESEFYDTSGIEFGKYIVPSQLYIGYFRKATNSKAIAHYSGNYYSEYRSCIFEVVYDAFAVSDALSYNTKVFGGKINCKRFGNFGVAARNFVMFGGSIEGYHDTTMLRATANLSFHGTYFETTVTSADRAGAALFVFRLIAPHATISFKDCLGYLNHTDAFIRDLEGAGDTSITLMGNNWRCGSSNDIPVMVVFGNANPPYGFVAGDTLTNFGPTAMSYIPSAAAKSKLKTYNSPMLFNATE